MLIAVLNSEPGWLCLMMCNFDVLFSTIVLQYIMTENEKKIVPPLVLESSTKAGKKAIAKRVRGSMRLSDFMGNVLFTTDFRITSLDEGEVGPKKGVVL